LHQDYEFDGHRYRIHKLGLGDAKVCLAQLSTMGFFELGLTALMSSADQLNTLEDQLFRKNCEFENAEGEWVPLGAKVVEGHFSGRLPAYYSVMVKAIKVNFDDFLDAGWTTALSDQEIQG